ncbi:hypothetical protein [Candidatus Regiella endosymbiont of Tuberolachnus salignus]
MITFPLYRYPSLKAERGAIIRWMDMTRTARGRAAGHLKRFFERRPV